MAFIEIPPALIEVGKALKKEIFDAIKASLDDHENRINSLAVGASPIVVFDNTILNASSAGSLTGLNYFRAASGFNISLVQLEIFDKGGITSGIVSFDIKKGDSLDDADLSTVLTIQPSIDFAIASDYDIATGTLDPLEQSVTQGQVIRLDITSLPSTPLGKFRVLVYGSI
jgi:hypothetical protein